MLTKEIAENILEYDPETGIFRYKVSTNNRVKAGDIAGSPAHGYLTIMYEGRNYRLHRVVFLIETGSFPNSQVDHINGVRSDNRRSNLRLVTNKQNCWNKKGAGACFNKRVNMYYSYVDHEGVREHLGYYKTWEEAFEVSQKRRKELKGEFYRPIVL